MLEKMISGQGNHSSRILVIAGGGGGARDVANGTGAGGGGAGGYRESTQSVTVGTTITITVGDGGMSQVLILQVVQEIHQLHLQVREVMVEGVVEMVLAVEAVHLLLVKQ
jgi:hypothetical protein